MRAAAFRNFNGTVIVQSSIIALNTASASPDVDGNFNSVGFNLIGQRDGSTGFTTNPTDQTGTIASPLDPLLSSAGVQNNGGPTPTVALLLGSPAIDKGINALTSLDAAINNSTTTINVVDSSNIPVGVGYTIRIDNEHMVAISKMGNVLTVTRAANGTSAASHSQGAILGSAFDQRGAGFPRSVDYPQFSNAAVDGADIGATEFGGPLVPISVSRKMHGIVPFDVNLPLTGPPGIECRAGGNHQLIMGFPGNVSVTSASVTSGVGSVSSFSVSGAAGNGESDGRGECADDRPDTFWREQWNCDRRCSDPDGRAPGRHDRQSDGERFRHRRDKIQIRPASRRH